MSGGFATVQYVLATAFSLVVFVMLANLVVFLYGRGVVRAALAEGARAGSPAEAGPAACEAAALDVLDDLLGGMRDQVAVHCAEEDGLVRARATVGFRSWLPALVPDWNFRAGSSAVKERTP